MTELVDSVRRRARIILGKWTLEALLVVVLVLAGLPTFVIKEVPVLLRDHVDTARAWGLEIYLRTFGSMWVMVALVLVVLVLMIYFLWYRRKRPRLKRGGIVEGRVIWSKGVMRGAVYDAWFMAGYIKWKRGRLDLKAEVLQWPDPMAISVLPDIVDEVVIWYSPPWSLRLRRLHVDRRFLIKDKVYSVNLPLRKVVNLPLPGRPGEWYLRMIEDDEPDWNSGVARSPFVFQDYDPKAISKDIRRHLDHSKLLVEKAVSTNPDIVEDDYSQGTYHVLGLGIKPEDVED